MNSGATICSCARTAWVLIMSNGAIQADVVDGSTPCATLSVTVLKTSGRLASRRLQHQTPRSPHEHEFPQSSAKGWARESSAETEFPFQRLCLSRPGGRHPRVCHPRQWFENGSPQLEIPPSTRHHKRGCGGIKRTCSEIGRAHV